MKRLMAVILCGIIGVAGCSKNNDRGETPPPAVEKATTVAVTLAELAQWQLLGNGSVVLDESEQALRMTETEGSKGITLLSPVSYGPDVIVKFSVKPATYESVNVVIIAASDSATGGDFTVPADHDGGFGFWTEGTVQDYVVAFHNGAHNRHPFITRNPGANLLVEADKEAVTENWHAVEIGRKEGRIWLSIDGAVVIETTDTASKPLPGGRVAFRLRGTPDKTASAWFRDVVVEEL